MEDEIGGFRATPRPTLPILHPGKFHLDFPLGSTLIDAQRASQRLTSELLSVANATGLLVFAPLVGEKSAVDVSVFRKALRDRIVSHNHPRGTMLSRDDLREAIDCDVLRIEAVMPDGDILAWNRPENSWPDAAAALRAYNVGFFRATTDAKGKPLSRGSLRKQIDRALRSALGDAAPQVDVSRVE